VPMAKTGKSSVLERPVKPEEAGGTASPPAPRPRKAGRGPRRKGARVEREVLTALREAGLEARRVPLSGSAPGYPGDLEVDLPGLGRVLVEVKARRRVALEAWLEGRGLLVLKPDRKPPLAVLPLEGFLRLVQALGGTGGGSGRPKPRPQREPRYR